MVDAHVEPSVRRQCELLRVSRSGLYYEPVPTSPDELALMRRIDELHLKYPFYGSRKVSFELRQEGREANREEALANFGQPEIFNTDQGAQFTADAFTNVLRKKSIAISMDGA